MQEVEQAEALTQGFQSRKWDYRYRTSTLVNGRPVDILHDFYIPALQLATRYDRVAGYFRSSSLAAASQGFSSFAQHGGKMRLIVGADLDPADVRAILAGNAMRLEQCLLRELESPGDWPETVQNGVALLAWMVARGILDVRVAFRRHAVTGEPLSFDSTEDGYVHEKWFVMYDAQERRIYGNGSLNESRTALQLNAESIDVHCDWWGEMERRRCDDAERTFELLWENEVPHLAVCALPEAVRQRLVRYGEGLAVLTEIDGTTVVLPSQPAAPSALERLRFAVIRDAPRMPGGQYVGIETAPVKPWPHQLVVARRLVDDWPYNYMLCDEVGLGKTIEAGLAFRSLYLSGLAKRILVAAPAGLTPQWLRQMATKMLLPFARLRTSPNPVHERLLPYEHVTPVEHLYGPDLLIVSTGLWTREGAATDLSAVDEFDVVLVDEAHMVRRRNPSPGIDDPPDYGNLYRLVSDKLRYKTRGLWLATATPLQLDIVEVADLLRLVGRVSGFQYEPMLMKVFYDTLEKLVQQRHLTSEQWRFLQDGVRSLKRHDARLWRFCEDYLMSPSARRALERWLEDQGRSPSLSAQRSLLRVIRMAAPLSRVMLRHTRELLQYYRDRGELGSNLAQREVLPVEALTYTEGERQVYELLNRYCEGLRQRLGRGEGGQRTSVKFLESLLRLRFASSLYAFEQTVARRLERVIATLQHSEKAEQTESLAPAMGVASQLDESVYEAEEEDTAEMEGRLAHRDPSILRWERRQLEHILDVIRRVDVTPSKVQRLLEVLDSRRFHSTGRLQQTVVFTRFYDTLVYLQRVLRERNPNLRLAIYSGSEAGYYHPVTNEWTAADREEVKERFLAQEIDVLLCTDAAAEGLNLQTADMLINFDLGWNPMKIEQRIGRIDRIGQRHDRVYVLNLCYANSEEGEVYDRLLRRLGETNLVVGPQQLSLLPIKPEEFQLLASGELKLEELQKVVEQRLKEEQLRANHMQLRADELYETYQRFLSEYRQQATPVRLADIWHALTESSYLAALGCRLENTPKGPVFVVRGIPGVPDGTWLTVSHELYEEGLPGAPRIHFASYGDPVFDTILAHFLEHPLPACVRRVSARASRGDGQELEVCGFVVATLGAAGETLIRHVTSYSDLASLEPLAEDEELKPEHEDALREALERTARERAWHIRDAQRVQEFNEFVGRYQEWLSVITADRLLRERRGQRDANTISAAAALRDYQEHLSDRDWLRVTYVPANVFKRGFAEALLVEDVDSWTGANPCTIRVGNAVIQAGRSRAERALRSFKVSRSSVTLQQLLDHLRREEEALEREVSTR